MMTEEISIAELYKALCASLGSEGAEKMIRETVAEGGFPEKEKYTKEEILKICDILKSKGGFIKIVASLFSARMTLLN